MPPVDESLEKRYSSNDQQNSKQGVRAGCRGAGGKVLKGPAKVRGLDDFENVLVFKMIKFVSTSLFERL